jgi:putative Mg2+ transporter-C (MgtC) family protein
VVRGLTTAAGLWVTAAIGLTCGSGMYLLAATATILVLLCLEVMNLILHRFGAKNILVTFISPNREGVQQVLRTLKADGIAISSCEMKDRHEACEVTLELQVKRDKYEAQLIALMDKLQGMSIERIE